MWKIKNERFYFRHEFLKKAKFLYQLNPNPCKSFTFPGNPSSSSKDYFEIVEYDVNRNSGPGAQRTIPLDNIENNLTDYFKEYWQKNCGHPYQDVVKYIKHISNSEWYKNTKKNYERFYFGVPKTFDTTFNPNTVTIEK